MSQGLNPLKINDLYSKLKKFGICIKRRGKGSHVILVRKDNTNSGLAYPISDHGKKTEVNVPTISAILRKFKIDNDDFLMK